MNEEALRRGREKQRQMREAGISPITLTPWQKLRDKPTLKRAITAMCCDCMGWEEGGDRPARIREEIRDCTVPRCPLFAFRPWKDDRPAVGKVENAGETPEKPTLESIPGG